MCLSGKWPHLKVRDLSEQCFLKKICTCCQVHEKAQQYLPPARVQALSGISINTGTLDFGGRYTSVLSALCTFFILT